MSPRVKGMALRPGKRNGHLGKRNGLSDKRKVPGRKGWPLRQKGCRLGIWDAAPGLLERPGNASLEAVGTAAEEVYSFSNPLYHQDKRNCWEGPMVMLNRWGGIHAAGRPRSKAL